MSQRQTVRPERARLVTPRRHGELLIDPPMGQLAEALGAGIERPDGRVWAGFGVSWAEAAGRARAEAAEAAGVQAEPERAWVFTGHQVEFYHAGVWAKVVAADQLARRVGGRAFDVLVDHDRAEHLGFDVPAEEAGRWVRRPTRFGAPTAAAADGLAAPPREAYAAWAAEVSWYPHANSDTWREFARRLEPREARYVEWMSRARREMEGALGIEVAHVPTSRLCAGLAWHLFVLAWARQARAWADVYNRQLRAYRQREGVQGPQHPMPDLMRSGAAQELPFWVYRVGEARQRAALRGGRKLVCVQDTIDLGPALGADSWQGAAALRERLAAAGVVVRPRALSLTLFIRLFVADLFIHGIGGALYDQITDGILEEVFGVSRPYACVSAAWLLPLGGAAGAGPTVAELQARRHHVAANPQVALGAAGGEVGALLAGREALVERLVRSVRERRNEERPARREWFRELHEILRQIHALRPEVLGTFAEQIRRAGAAAENNKVVRWREYFWGLHTTASLRELIAAVRGAG